MKRTPEAIAQSLKAFDLGKKMIQLISLDSGAQQMCENGLATLQKWIDGAATVTECRRTALDIHEFARNCTDEQEKNAIRAVAHAVATAHVSTHLQACEEYARKACAV